MIKKSLVLFLLAFCFGLEARANDLRDIDYDAPKQAASASTGAGVPEVGGSIPVESTIATQVKLVIDQDTICARYISGATAPTLQKPLAAYTAGKPSCVSAQESADLVCRDSTSPELASTLSKVNMALTAIGAVAVKDACSNFAKVMDIAKAGLSAYTATCGALKANCSSSCVKTESALITMQKLLSKEAGTAVLRESCAPENMECLSCGEYVTIQRPKYIQAAITTIAKELNKAEVKSISGKVTLCVGKYAELLTSAGMGIISVANSMKQGQNCDAATAGTTTTADLSNLDVKCAMAEYKNTSECICHLNPRQTGCVNSLDKAGSSNQYSGMNTGNGSSNVAPVGGSVSLPTGNDATMPDISGKGASSAGMPGAPSGGGSGVGGGSAGGNSGGPGGEGEHKGLNTNILAGSGGGGGGGFGGGFGGGSAADSKYRPYLPGGAKDPSRGVAGQAISNEVTGQAGKSNWEKVRDRYRDNNSSLLGN